MFRYTLEGRFATDVVRTMMQTTVAEGVPVHEHLESFLHADQGSRPVEHRRRSSWRTAPGRTAA